MDITAKHIKVCGFPFVGCIFNTNFKKTNRTSNNMPIYRLEQFLLFGDVDVFRWRGCGKCFENLRFQSV